MAVAQWPDTMQLNLSAQSMIDNLDDYNDDDDDHRHYCMNDI